MSIPLSVPSVSSSSKEHLILFRRLGNFIPAGVAILSKGEVTMTVSSLHFVSFEPPIVSLALARDSKKGRIILESGRFHARLLRDTEQDAAKGEGFPVGPGLLEMDCIVEAVYPEGDHHLVLAAIRQASASHGFPIIYWRRGFHQLQRRYEFLSSREAFHDFLSTWEGGALPRRQWTHAGHVAIGAYYAVRFPDTAFEHTRNGILRHNEAVGTVNSDCSGYHETLTRLWSLILTKVTQGFSDPWMAACHAVERLGEDRDLHCLYYSFDVVRSAEARRVWIAPDLEGPY
jgi:flavin reductase (DIM6/NTAB) family NADH-FMN oxidoreductase RutF